MEGRVILAQMFSALDTATLSLAKELPLEWFVIIASFIEEVIAPVPALAVLMTTGSLAAIQGRTVPELLPLILLATIGKSIGAIIVYFLADKVGVLMVSKFGKFFEITPADIERLGSKITDGPRDYLILTLIRAAPIIPSSVVSVGSGLLKIPFRVYMVATVLGTIFRDGFFLYVGYTGTEFLSTLATDTDNVESLLQNGFILIVLMSLMYLFYRHRKKAHRQTPAL